MLCNIQYCNIIIIGETFYFKQCKLTIKNSMDCNAMNCIYVLKCSGCGELYIGETTNLRLRKNVHKDHARQGIGLYVSRHIFRCTENKPQVDEKFKFMPIFKINRDEADYRRTMKAHYKWHNYILE